MLVEKRWVDKHLRRTVATMISLALHGLLLLGLLDHAPPAVEPRPTGQGGTAMTLLNLTSAGFATGDTDGEDAPPQPAAEATEPEGPIPSEVDATAYTTETADWSIGAEAAAMPMSSTSQQSAMAGSDYDPYAGAAPMRRSEGSASPPALDTNAPRHAGGAAVVQNTDEDTALFELDQRAFDTLRKDARDQLGSADGTVKLRVRVSAVGVVIGAEARGGSLSANDKASIIRLIIGRSMFYLREPVAQGAMIDLPEVKLQS